jgi:hypothetical protein
MRRPPLERCKHGKVRFSRRRHSRVGEFRRNRAGNAAAGNGAARSARARSAPARGAAARSAPARGPAACGAPARSAAARSAAARSAPARGARARSAAARRGAARMAAVVLRLPAGGGAILRPSEAGRGPHSLVPHASLLQVAASLPASAHSGAPAIVESRKGAAACAPFPFPARQTGRADFERPAFRPSSLQARGRRRPSSARFARLGKWGLSKVSPK